MAREGCPFDFGPPGHELLGAASSTSILSGPTDEDGPLTHPPQPGVLLPAAAVPDGGSQRLGGARLVVGEGVLFPVRAAACAELVSLALVVVVRVPLVQMKQAPQRLHVVSLARMPALG